MNTHLTIRTILAAAALSAVIGMTSALSGARAGEVDTPSKTLGASGAPEPSPYVDYDNTWLRHSGLECCTRDGLAAVSGASAGCDAVRASRERRS